MMEKNAKIYVAGHRGMVGSAIVRELQRQGYSNFVFRTHKEMDLTRQDQVEAFFPKKNQNMYSIRRERSGESSPIRMDWRILCMKT